MSDRLQRIEELFHAALARPADARDAFLSAVCSGDETLRREVSELLALTSGDDDFLERPPALVPGIELAAGSRLGPYEIDTLIGAGGMGEVYRARDTRLRRTVALKLMPSHLRADPDLRARFEREARAIAGLNHPNICALHDLGHDRGLDFLVMEYVDGETVADALRRGPLSIDAAIRVGTAVASALAAAHAKGLIHRDVKPSNIIVARDGIPKLVDFGLAMTAPAFDTPTEGAGSRITRTGVFVGTPQYMSPQQVVRQPLDSRTDIFSLGVVLFECLTGKRPFEGDTPSAYLKSLLSAPPRSIRAFRSDVPAALEQLVMRCLEKDVAERQISAFELATELTRVWSGSNIAPLRPSRVRRRTWRAAILVLGIGITSVWAIHEWRGLSAPTDTPELRPIVQWPGLEWNSRISPDGQWVSFLSDRGGLARVWVKRLQGDEDARSIDAPAGEVVGHTWSPDSREIACTVVGSGGTFLHIVSAHGAGPARLSVRVGDPADRWAPAAWSGSTVFLFSLRRLLAFDERTKTLKDLTAQSSMKPESIGIRSDGHRVVFETAAKTQKDIWIANVDGTRAVRLTDDGFSNRFPIWAGPNAVVFASDRGGQTNLWQMDVTSRTMRQITSSADSKIAEAASSDGSIITFRQMSGTADLWETDPDTRKEHQLTLDGRSYFWPSASASRLIAVQMMKSEHHFARVLLLDTDIMFGMYDHSAVFQPLAERVSDAFAPRLSADGKFVAFLRWATDQKAPNPVLFVAALGTGTQVKVTDRFAMPGFKLDPPSDQQGSAMSWARDRPDLYFVARTEAGAPEIRRFRAGLTSESDLLAGSFGDKDVVLDVVASPDGRRLGYDRWTGTRTEIHVLDLESRKDRVVWSEPASWRFAVTLKGWRADGSASALMAVRSGRNEDETLRAELLQIDLDGRLAGPFRITDRGYSVAARLDPVGGELYVATVDGAIHNISAFSIADHRLRQVTNNTFPGVTFSGIDVETDGRLLYSRQETKQDIWAIRFRR